MASFPSACISSSSCAFLLIISACSGAMDTNTLLTGETLRAGERLSYGGVGASLVMQNDCDLVVLRGGGYPIWNSGTACLSCGDCNLSFTDNGQLVVRDRRGSQRWITPNENSGVGIYVAILRPEGQVAVYGPGIWSVGAGKERMSINYNEMISSMNSLRKDAVLYNILFSGQALYNNDKLSANGYDFIMQDCELVLKESSTGEIAWRTWTRGYGDDCYAELNRAGELSIIAKNYNLIWSNEVHNNFGDYALVLLKDGNVVIYGPKVWSTEDPKSGLAF